jgi:uncharacterized repeat protein (TIGR01451 family)
MNRPGHNHPRPSPLLALLGPLLLAVSGAADGQVRPGQPASGEATATGTGPLVTQTVVEILEEGRFVPAERVRAGDEVHYTVRVTNPGARPVENVVVTKLMPVGLDYAPRSAVGPGCDVQVSSDNGVTFVAEPKPKSGQHAYTHLRWILDRPLPPGATALLRFRATFR